MQSLQDTCAHAAAGGAHVLLNNVRQRLQRFVGDSPQYDDMTLLALHVEKV
jgi:serine phosphatase RsbU (regulator of sigma subunit)